MKRRSKTPVCNGLIAAVLAVLPASAQIADRDQLGFLSAGDVVTLPLDAIIAPTRIVIEIDGQVVTAPVGVSGASLSLRLPDDLRGARHDIAVFEKTPTGPRQIGTWEFETARGAWDTYAAVVTEAGMRSAAGRTESYGKAGGRLDFDLDGGRFRGGLSFGRAETRDPTSGDWLTIGDWFLETRGSLGGDTLRFRLGSHYFETDGKLIDQGSRRGVSLRLTDPSGAHDSLVFALQPAQVTGTRNLLGLEDTGDRVMGVISRVRPFAASGLHASVVAYDGHARNMPDGAQGRVRGAGLALTGPIGTALDFALTADRAEWHDGSAWHSGTALGGETSLDITPASWEGKLSVTLGYDRIEQDFYSPLNPNLISGEAVTTLSLDRTSREWDWGAELAVGRTNIGGAANLPVDRLQRLSFDVTYAPEVFTGGFLNGTSFFAGAEMLRQDRIRTPTGAVGPSDNTMWSLSLGMDRFQPDHSFALLYRYDVFDDRVGSGQDQKIHGIEGLLSFTPNSRFDASVSAEVELDDGPDGKFWRARGSGALRYELIEDSLVYGLEVGFERSDNPAFAEGGFVGNELAWEFRDNHALVFSADYGRGTKSNTLTGKKGWLFGIALRSEFSVARFR